MSWEDTIKKKKYNSDDAWLNKFDSDFNTFVEILTDYFIENEIKDDLERKNKRSDSNEYSMQTHKNLETALKEVLYDDISKNIWRKLNEKVQEIFTETDELGNLLILIEAIDKNEAEFSIMW